MLRSLHIENIAVIKSVDIDFSEGFCALTGETGAGKSILIDSINLLLGERFSKELIRTGEKFASVSAVFDIREDTARAISELGIGSGEEREIMLQRTVSSDGRSSAS
jgi:DNA repair protein RecN (Recombination protein N)